MSIGKNTTIGMATDLAVFGLGIVVSIVLTRSLGPEQRGIYALLVTTNVLLASVSHLSAGNAFSTQLARGRYTLGQVNTLALGLSLVLGAACTLAATLAYPLLRGSLFQSVPYIYLLVALVLTASTIYQIYWNSMMIGLNRLILLNKLNLAVNLINALLMILVVGVLRLGMPGFLGVWTFSGLAGAASAAIIAGRIEPFGRLPDRAGLRHLLGFGLRSQGADIAQRLFLRYDMYMVNALAGTRAVGFYSLSTSLAEKLWLALNAINASSKGKIARLPREESAQLTARMSRTALLMMLSLAIPFAIISPWLVPFLYGPDFSASVLPLLILLCGTPAFAVMQVLNNYIIGQMERPGLLSIISWLELLVSLPLYTWLILWQGTFGAALASTLTYLMAMSATLFIYVRDSGLPFYLVLIPRPADFHDYARVLRAALSRFSTLDFGLNRSNPKSR